MARSGPDNKMKEEVYSNLSGINSKVGLYSNGPMEFQDMVNFDFQRPGALSQRWGSTLYQSQNFSGPITALYEYVKLDGSSYLMVGTSGALWSGATTGQAQGISFTYSGITTHFGPVISNIVFGAGSILELSFNVPLQNNVANTLDLVAGTSAQIFTASQNPGGGYFDFAVFQNTLFAGDGNQFFKYDGATTSFVCLPPAVRKNNPVIAGSASFGFATTSSYYALFASYVNRRGFEGPIWLIGCIQPISGATVSAITGNTLLTATYTFSTPLEYDIASINIYAYTSSLTLQTNSASLWSVPYRFLMSSAASGSTTTDVTVGAGASANINAGEPPPLTNYLPLGFTIQNLTNSQLVSEIDIQPFYPRYLEIFQNRLFSAGFSGAPSTVWFSDVGEPEGYDPSWNLEVRTNDGDRITAMQAYNSRLYIFKQFSFSELSGDNPDNFFERIVSGQYGCLSNRAVTIFNDIMLFLDVKGVMRFNGASLDCISGKVQPIFDSMNLSAALDHATMVHDKSRNEILIGIPVNGSSVNNMTVVYDYLMDCWTKYEGYNPSVYAEVKQRSAKKTAMFGGYSGQVMNFGASLPSDNGIGFTTYFKTGFHADVGQTNEALWRRLWTNVDEVTGATVSCNINFFQNYGTSIVLNRTTYLSPFQSRMDFGISAKSLAFEFSKFSASTMIRYYGHGFAYRFQRGV